MSSFEHIDNDQLEFFFIHGYFKDQKPVQDEITDPVIIANMYHTGELTKYIPVRYETKRRKPRKKYKEK